MILYHATYNIDQAEYYKFIPRVPDNCTTYEDMQIPRICFADSIRNCIRSISGILENEQDMCMIRVYEFEIDENDKNLITWEELYQNDWVDDAALTHEYWYLEEICLKSKIYKIENVTNDTYTVISNKQKENIIDILKGIRLFSPEIERHTASYIINEWIKDNYVNSDEIVLLVKKMLCHEESTEECNIETFRCIWGNNPNVKKKVCDYHDVRLIKSCRIIEVS